MARFLQPPAPGDAGRDRASAEVPALEEVSVMSPRRLVGARLSILLVALTLLVPAPGLLLGQEQIPGVSADPAHNLPLPCESVSTPGLVPRSARNLTHIANVCGFVGTDIEFQSRRDAAGRTHDYAFVGTMGAGLRIFDITNPARPTNAGGYVDPGWQNDVQVRGNTAVVSFDPIVVGVHVSDCLRAKQPTAVTEGGVDVVRLRFDATTARFTTELIDCYVVQTEGNGAHNATLHPSGTWLAIDTTQTGVEVVDLRTTPFQMVRKIPEAVTGSAHDTSFSRDGKTMYAASPGTGTYIVDVSRILQRDARTIGFIPNNTEPGGEANPRNVEISHQADVSSNGRILVFTDERGGGLSNTSCNTAPGGIIGGMHFWALGSVSGGPKGASPSTPKRLGSWFYPNPTLAVDPLAPTLTDLGRTERGCTIHVFRNGGNGSVGPGPIQSGFDGVSSLPATQAVAAHYGAGVWWIDFSSRPTATDGIAESEFTDWGNTRGWNVMPGADTWSAKEYKGHIYAGDMTRGFDVYAFSSCSGVSCISVPAAIP
jgi:LVIVD repeat-containing protein